MTKQHRTVLRRWLTWIGFFVIGLGISVMVFSTHDEQHSSEGLAEARNETEHTETNEPTFGIDVPGWEE